jgi:dynein heavy chain 1
MAGAHLFVSSVFTNDFMKQAERVLDLATIVDKEVGGGGVGGAVARCQPVLLCSVPGYDASGRVEDLAVSMERPVTSIAIGQ